MALIASISTTLVACSDSGDDNTSPKPGKDSRATRDSSTSNDGGSGTPDATTTLGEPEIAAIASALNKGEISQGNVATSKAVRADVKTFATQMVSEHTATLDREAALSVTPRDNPDSVAVTTKAQAALAILNAKTGAEFDVAYIDIQIAMHTDALQILDTKLIPSATRPQIKADLTITRGAVQMHLDHARTIRQTLGADGGGAGDGGDAGSRDAGGG